MLFQEKITNFQIYFFFSRCNEHSLSKSLESIKLISKRNAVVFINLPVALTDDVKQW